VKKKGVCFSVFSGGAKKHPFLPRFWGCFLTVFWAFSPRFGIKKSSKKGQKRGQKRVKKGVFLGCFWGCFWGHF
jgi:hypothetical protein